MEANYGNDKFWGPWPKSHLATPMVLWQLHSTVLVPTNDY